MSAAKKKTLVVDVETNIFEKGNPFARQNKLMCVGTFDSSDSFTYYDIEHSGKPYSEGLAELKQQIEQADLLILFNAKFDLSWVRRYIPDIKFPEIWDCQLAQYILNDQTTPMLSLNACLSQHGLRLKSDYIEKTYWSQGIDTDKIPWADLREYNEGDCELTQLLYEAQEPLLTGNTRQLMRLHCADLLVLQEMEFNGLMFDSETSLIKGAELESELQKLHGALNELVCEPRINWNSPFHISAVLYGGTIEFDGIEEVSRPRKDGSVRVYSRKCKVPQSFPRLVEPLEGSETAGGFSTAEPVLRSLGAKAKAKAIIDLVLSVSMLDKLISVYYNGLTQIIDKMDWEPNTIHGQLNQCVTKTGRISASKPNQQNLPQAAKSLFYSRHQ